MGISSKNNVLLGLAGLLKKNKSEILRKNALDMDSPADMDESVKDRLKVDENKVDGMIRSLREVAEQEDPEGKVLYDFTRADGLRIVNRSVPFGTILIIYESRPDVTIEAAATAFRRTTVLDLKKRLTCFYRGNCRTKRTFRLFQAFCRGPCLLITRQR